MSKRHTYHVDTLIRHGVLRLLFGMVVLLPLAGCTMGDDAELGSPLPTDAAEFAKQMVTSLFSQPARSWEMLPAKYKNDVNLLVRGFAKQVDPEIWNRTFAVLQRGSKLLVDKQSLLTQDVPNGSPAEELGKKILPFYIRTIDELVKCDLANHQVASTSFDMGVVLQGPLGNSIAELTSGTFDAVKSAGGGGGFLGIGGGGQNPLLPMGAGFVDFREADFVVEFTMGNRVTITASSGDYKTVGLPWVLVDGSWVPADIDVRWPTIIGNLRASLTNNPAITQFLAENKTVILEMLNATDNAFGQLEKANNAQEFELGAALAFAPVFAAAQKLKISPEMQGVIEAAIQQAMSTQQPGGLGGQPQGGFGGQPPVNQPSP